MLKLCRHLYAWDPQSAYFDYYEHVLLNHRVGTIRPHVGTTQYYLSLTPGVWKTFATEDQTFWCCTGTGIEEYAKLADSIYWRDDEGVYVNLFIASLLTWQEEHFVVRQDTTFPASEHTTFTIVDPGHRPLTIRVRVPGWLHSSPVVKLNGAPLEASATPGGYVTLTRTWKAGDRVEMDLPMRLRMRSP